jgi:hypothetical protein
VRWQVPDFHVSRHCLLSWCLTCHRKGTEPFPSLVSRRLPLSKCSATKSPPNSSKDKRWRRSTIGARCSTTLSGSTSRLGFQWLSTADSVSHWTSTYQGMVGVSAGMHPHTNFQHGTNADAYRANAFAINAADPSGGSNPDFLFHMPSAYSFEPELLGLRDILIRMRGSPCGVCQ